jgi:hypothetical protein
VVHPHVHRNGLDHAPESLSRHGIATPRGLVALAGSRGGRFGRMFASLPSAALSSDTIAELTTALTDVAGTSLESTRVTAGYTYLGQFVDHDITFDPTPKLQRESDSRALVNFRTPRFDLDSLYGSGRADQPFLYDWSWRKHPGVKLLVGHYPDATSLAKVDLPRNEQERALIGDARNDENLVIAQLHLLFIHFHNRVVDHVVRANPRVGTIALFEEAQRVVRWHYQWIVTHDFLPQIIGDVAPFERGLYTWHDQPFMPVEFSGAAFRFGHSMVREDYTLNDGPNVSIFGRSGDDLRGFRRLPAALEVEWKNFFRTSGTSPQNSMRIDTRLAEALSHVPPDGAPLAWLNLQRGRALGLPAGPDVARAMDEAPLGEADLLAPWGDRIGDETCETLLHATPLWYYILREAEVRGGGGQHLGPVGGRIVAEVLLGLLEADPNSYLRRWPTWQPELPRAHDASFTMADLVRFTLGDEHRSRRGEATLAVA